MNLLSKLKARFPKLYPFAAAAVVLGSVGGYAAYERLSGDCCFEGSPCCHPGAACCTRHKVAQKQRQQIAAVEPLREAELDPLMDRLARGDRSAFPALYAALRPRAVRLAQARLGRGDAPDVAQAALLKVFARASDFTPGRPCLPWFYAIVANEIRSIRTRNARLVLDESAAENVIDPAHGAEAQLLTRELERALELAVDSLDDGGANAIRAMLGRVAVPDVTPFTLRKRVSRAYVKLRLLLGGHDVG